MFGILILVDVLAIVFAASYGSDDGSGGSAS